MNLKKSMINLTVLTGMVFLFACSENKGPVDADGRPLILKTGTIDCDLVETTPVVFKNRVFRFEYVRHRYWNNSNGDSYFRFVDHETRETTPSFARGFHLGSAYVYNDTVYVTAVDIWNGERVYIFTSGDLKNWNQRLAFELPVYAFLNTSMNKADNKFVLMFEIGKPQSVAGVSLQHFLQLRMICLVGKYFPLIQLCSVIRPLIVYGISTAGFTISIWKPMMDMKCGLCVPKI